MAIDNPNASTSKLTASLCLCFSLLVLSMMKRFRFGDEGEMMESINMANVLMLLSQGGEARAPASLGRVFECKTCNRQFPSFQALGGHRASHKKPKTNGDSRNQVTVSKPRTHECAICGLEFTIGQALGGHMRRHRALGQGFVHVGHGAVMEKRSTSDHEKVLCLDLDLNLPPSPSGVVDGENRTVLFGIDLVEKTPMVVDCFQ